MDFSLREWLIVVGVIVIVGVLIDGYRRVRSGSRGRIKMSIDKGQKHGADDRMDYFGGELPNGGARVVKRAGETAPQTAGEEKPVSAFDVAHELRPDPLFADDDPDIGDFEEARQQQPVAQASVDDSRTEGVAPQQPRSPEVEAELRAEPRPEPNSPLSSQLNSELDPQLDPQLDSELDSETGPEQKSEAPAAAQKAAFQEVEEVIVMNVFSRDDSGFNGSDLMRVILACGMRYGEMDIFHREEDGAGAAIQFSMANLVKPGTFDLDDMDNFSTPGVSFFLSLPGPKNSMKAFDYMYETAQCVVKNLNGELKDEMHSAMTSQTIEHSRQKIRDFERRQLSLLR